ncbi:putative helicase MOV-10 isoform X2 [Ixodes scapularis]|uniref:putative helicase MOV-10 isoform X2 n=1 Tax=Ixodes scapularis TaxID=6945 RepID=UPI001C38F13B|nr:putative helicase MOV-10 isoform X2 [Ixodes scapularis]
MSADTPLCASDTVYSVSAVPALPAMSDEDELTEPRGPSCRPDQDAEPNGAHSKADFVAFLRRHLCQDEDRLARGKNITVSCSETRDRTGISLLVQQNQELRFKVFIRVSSGSTPYVLLLECALLYPGPLVAFSDPTDLAAGDKEIIIAPGSSYPIGLQCFSQDTGTFVVPLALTFQQGCSSLKQFTVLTFLEVSCSENTFLELLEANIPKNISAPVLEEDCTSSKKSSKRKDASAEALEDDYFEGVGCLEVSCSKNASVEPLKVNIPESAPLPVLGDDCSKDVSAEFLENDCSEGVGHLVVSCSENTSMELLEINILKNTSIPVLEEDCSKDAPSAKLLQDVCSVSVGLSELSCSKSTPVETLVVNCPETASAENLGISWSKGWSGDISVEPLKVEYFSRSTTTFGGSTFVEPSKVEYPKDDSVEDLKVNYSKNTSGEALKVNRSKSRYVQDVDVEYSRNSSLEFLEVNFYKNAPVKPLAVNGFKSTHGCNGSKGYQPSFCVHNPQRIGFRNFRGFGRGLPKARCAVEASVQGERLKSPLSPDTYLEVFSTLLFLEEIKIDANFRKPGNASLHLRPLPNYGGWFVLEVPDSLVGNSSILEGSNVKVDLYSGQKKLGPKFAGKITEIKTGMIFLKFSERFQETYKEGMKVDLRFVLNRLPLRLMHRAIRMCNERKLWNFVLPDCDDPSRPAVNISELSFFNRSIATNAEQCSAVENIVLGLHRPYPFLLFGPPGTGKTVTLVEALIQVCTLIPSSHILVVAPSNSACDNLAEKLLGYLGPSQILRIYSASVHRSKLSKKLQHCSNYVAGGTFFYPDVEDLQKYRVIVTTLAGSGKLVSGQVPINHFTHIFVDEAGQSLEPECLIPVVGLMTPWNLKRKGTGGHLILAGDPLQLGPVVCNQWCRDHGLGTSLLERLMKRPPYKRQADGCYNPRMLSKLLKNFRSHKDILEIPNKLFYEGELQACAERRVCEHMLQWEGLPCKGCPLLFHAVRGSDLREEDNPSHFNPEEIQLVLHYVDVLLEGSDNFSAIKEEDIGIVSPYRQQVMKILAALNKRGRKEVTVGSTEQFQGRERLVIIISTVRSEDKPSGSDSLKSLGFLTNEKRFNVSITRAKALLIVIGNPDTLSGDPCWRSLVEFCIKKGAYTDAPLAVPTESCPKLPSVEDQLSRLVIGDDTSTSKEQRPDQLGWQH